MSSSPDRADRWAGLLARCTFPPPGTDLACAVSGGADSLALLVLAVAAGCRVTAFHVDHALRPGSEAEGEVVAAAAGRFGAGFVALRAPVDPGPNLEERARDARRAVLPPGAATGHTADDQAETVVLNLLRGAGLDGLAGMRPGAAHPILGIRREETRSLCREAGLSPVEDPTNACLDIRRNRVRHEVMPLLERVGGRDVAAVIARQAALLRVDADQLDALAAGIDPQSVAEVAAAPEALARRALRAWLRGALGGRPPSSAAVERVMAVVRLDARAAEVGRGVTVRRRAGRLYFAPD